MNRIRVLHVIDSLELGGAQTVLLEWLASHHREQFEVEIAAMHGDRFSMFHERVQSLQLPVHYLSPHRWWPSYFLYLPWLILTKRYEVVHCHLFASNWIAKPLAKLLGVRVVVGHDHCNDQFRASSPIATRVDRWANRFADHIYAVSASIRDYLIQVEHLPSEKVEVLRNGVGEAVQVRSKSLSTKRIGGAGRLVAQKNFSRFIKVARALCTRDSHYEFSIAGSGPLESELREEAESLHVPIRWLGQLPSLDRYFNELDLFLLTSDFEGLPMVILEALRAGVPVVASSVDGVNEFFGDEILKIPLSATPEEWATHIDELMHDSERKDAMGKSGRALIEKDFLAKNQIEQMEKVYGQLLKRGEEGGAGVME